MKKLISKDDIILREKINVFDETSSLKKVLLHRPGEELLNLVPEYLPQMLFDDIPWLEKAQEEHDAFAQILKDNGCEVVYLADLVCEALAEKSVREEFVRQFVKEGHIYTDWAREYVAKFLLDRPIKETVQMAMGGIRKSQIELSKKNLSDYMSTEYPFVLPPMPNLYFTRDPFAFAGRGVISCKMYTNQRSRETIFGEYIFKYHPKFNRIKSYYDRNNVFSVEGGDILVLGSGVLAVGISQRSQVEGVEKLAKNILFSAEEGSFHTILAIDIPKSRSFMHLDTVFTALSKDMFTVHPVVSKQFYAFALTNEKGALKIEEKRGTLDNILKEVLRLDKITLIKCGGESAIDSAREQWNDGANTLAIADKEVVVYARNTVTNALLKDYGVKIHEMASSELSRGRGGPRCMSMPLYRG